MNTKFASSNWTSNSAKCNESELFDLDIHYNFASYTAFMNDIFSYKNQISRMIDNFAQRWLS